MTKTKKILQLLALEPALTIEQIAERLNASSLYRTQQSVYRMRADGILAVRPVTYSITADGLARLKEAPKGEWSPERKAARNKKLAAQAKKRRQLAKEQKASERKSTKTSTSVQHAIRTQPTSVFALGAM